MKHKCRYTDAKTRTRKDGSQYIEEHCVIEIENSVMEITLDEEDWEANNGASVPISFCPFCGEKLKEGE